MFKFYSPPGPNRVTVVGEHTNGVLRMAVSRSSKKDNFNRKKGSMIAEGRLRKGRIAAEVPMEECTGQNFVAAAIEVANNVLADSTKVHG